MSATQLTAWPDTVLTVPKKICEIDESSKNIGKDADGWKATFSLIRFEIDCILSETRMYTNAKILDAGCGDGVLADEIDFKQFGVDLYGIDIESKFLDNARDKGNYFHLQLENHADPLSFSDGFFDMVIANGCLDNSATHKPLFEFLRIVKPGGYVIITMRTHQFVQKGFKKGIEGLKTKCKVAKKHNFKPEYICVSIRKTSD